MYIDYTIDYTSNNTQSERAQRNVPADIAQMAGAEKGNGAKQ